METTSYQDQISEILAEMGYSNLAELTAKLQEMNGIEVDQALLRIRNEFGRNSRQAQLLANQIGYRKHLLEHHQGGGKPVTGQK